MAVFTLEELAKLKGGAAKVAGGGGGFWTPENINTIVKNVRGLLQDYNAMRGGGAVARADQGELTQGPPGPGQQLTAPGQGVTMPQLYSFAKQVLTNLETQGYADKTPFEVLQAFTLTIRQLKGMIP